MLPKLSILVRGISAILMIAALFFLTTANFWVYGMQKEKQAVASVNTPSEEEQDGGSPVPNPVEEKSSNTLQNLSEYLHGNHHSLEHPVAIHFFGNRHDIINYPVHHCDLVTPPPKSIA